MPTTGAAGGSRRAATGRPRKHEAPIPSDACGLVDARVRLAPRAGLLARPFPSPHHRKAHTMPSLFDPIRIGDLQLANRIVNRYAAVLTERGVTANSAALAGADEAQCLAVAQGALTGAYA